MALLVFPLVALLFALGGDFVLAALLLANGAFIAYFLPRYKQGGIRGIADWWDGSAIERAMTFMALVLIGAFVILLVASAL